MKTQFTTSIWNAWSMREKANQIAKDAGLTDSKQIDAFRHSYVSAKMQEAYGERTSAWLGGINEISRGMNKFLGGKGNPAGDWEMDEFNNAFGRKIEEDLAQQNLTIEAKEKLLRERLRDAVTQGELKTQPVLQESQPPFDYIFPGQVIYSSSKKARAEGGDVNVKSYSRATGEVKGHTRTRADGEVGNNKSFKFKK